METKKLLLLTIENCTLDCGRNSVELSAKELMILIKLFVRREKAAFVSPVTLNREIWKEEEFRGKRDSQKIRYYLFRMKKKISDSLHIEDIFYSVHGKGYKLNDAVDLKIQIVEE